MPCAKGKLTDLLPGTNRIILGRLLAYQLQVGAGDTVVVMIPGIPAANGGGFTPRLQEFQVVRHLRGGFAGARQRYRLGQFERRRGVAQSLRPNRHSAQVSTMCLKAPDLARIAAARLNPKMQVRDWTQENEAYFPRHSHREDDDRFDSHADSRGGGVQHCGDAGHGRERQAHRYRDLENIGIESTGSCSAVFMTQACVIGGIGDGDRCRSGLALRPECSM